MNLERYRQNNPVLAGILDRVALIRGYQAIVDGLVSGRSGQSVKVLNIDEQTLTLGVTSAAMASRMRFEATDLLDRLHKALTAHPGAPKPAAIRVRVIAEHPTPGNPPRSLQRPASPSGSRALSCLAESQDDPALSRSLNRLAQLLQPKKE
ncbi:MAG TPA: DciA family protein [Guyparkeria sp.]|nr:DciA family protein [Guyparkeria sp.]